MAGSIGLCGEKMIFIHFTRQPMVENGKTT